MATHWSGASAIRRKREAEKGDRDAARALERHEAREAERNRDRDDDGRGIEP